MCFVRLGSIRALITIIEIPVSPLHSSDHDIGVLGQGAEQALSANEITKLHNRGRIEGDEFGHRSQFSQLGVAPVINLPDGKEERRQQQADAQ